MATRQTRALSYIAVTPSVLLLFLWMIVPLVMTIYFSLLHYNLLDPDSVSFIGFLNYQYFLSDPAFIAALFNTLKLVGGVLIISVGGGVFLALLLDQPIWSKAFSSLVGSASWTRFSTWRMSLLAGFFAADRSVGRITRIVLRLLIRCMYSSPLILLRAVSGATARLCSAKLCSRCP